MNVRKNQLIASSEYHKTTNKFNIILILMQILSEIKTKYKNNTVTHTYIHKYKLLHIHTLMQGINKTIILIHQQLLLLQPLK